ncbi:zinc ribbon domain-containing protein [Cloacibacillus evryensis]|uniref:zinc ribbon domain-containing protein n=1 Tax=Cloacibacillus evryensis TaxID=508460 RepID=UPI002B202722|nr:zinc ribbon domain-containing protein [Cloacibacillus evryensis]MEA5035807.1 zinc ribbon domain-containing protein [Cloacibacillus evryensis]
MAKKKTNKNIPLPILILICAVLLFAMYLSLSTLALAIWGDSVMGTVDSYDSRRDDTTAQENRSRTVSKGYWFMANGKEYHGYVIYSSDEAWPSLKEGETRSERICYLDVFPYVNKPAMLCEFSEMGEVAILYHILAPIGYLLLLLLVIRTSKRGKKKKTTAKKPAVPRIIEARSDTDMYCPNCGSKLSEGAAFCSACGAKTQASAPGVCTACGMALPEGAEFCIGCGAAVNPVTPQPMEPSQATAPMPSQGGAGLVGFSDRCNSPEILAAAQKNKKSSIGCMWILVFVPLIGFPIAGLLMDDFPFGESLVIGVGIALVMLVINLLALRRTKQPMWEGVVVNKYSKEKSEHRGGEDDNYRTYTEYTTIINIDAGKKKTIVEKDSGRHMYDYLSVGNRVRYHPRFGTYEKYDKSKDRIIYCNVCSMMNPIQNDRCKRCNNLLFK